ncbi:lysophospholipid acyltransferase 7 [Glossina fuscipes]|uniref:Lysophospholipid acyltransferase 7 n=1 Tax=Glossina fuscipes TaxID=7396 RepID=A0A9C5Z5V8_9MUSC|nr:lysophospholipid acyltransferase 7 [Glossina fuscipes]KAI9578528.1 hypothetical protein GQX74_009102 [Glossina fuscipes]
MNFDDIIYVLCLLSCVGAGKYVKKIEGESQRKLICTLFGLVVAFFVSGWHILHCIISAFLGALAVVYVHPSKTHLITFVIMFAYLAFFRLAHVFGFTNPPGPTNMIQMVLTLKVSGVAFEKASSWKKLKQREQELSGNKPAEKELVEISDYDVELQSIDIIGIFQYSFNYIGVLTGPYYRYRTYRDYFETPFKDYAPCVETTVENLKFAAIYSVIYATVDYIWPLSYALSPEFYERSFIYRFWYIWPAFLIFRMRIYAGLCLSECVCNMAGFGAYPEESDATNGEGPRKQYLHLKRDADKRSYNFNTIVNIRVKEVEKCFTLREGMKHWNVCVQYWLAVNIYRQFPSKKYRTAVTLLCSAYWHGFRPGHYFCLLGAASYVTVEDIWQKLVAKEATGLKRLIIDYMFWFAKSCIGYNYLGTAFVLVSFSNIWNFYSSIYHVGYIAWFLMLASGVVLTKRKTTISVKNK